MSLFGLFRRKEPTAAATAKDRLQIVLAHERADRNTPDFLPTLQNEILATIRKYVAVDIDKVAVRLQREKGRSILEVNVELPGPPMSAARGPVAAS
ncbi:MAG: cell division topological specificity factor MinE [Rhodospirillaceae bacterium]|nr:cell division topological specificity factor MinE [Rhodospirillaceae bacterium]